MRSVDPLPMLQHDLSMVIQRAVRSLQKGPEQLPWLDFSPQLKAHNVNEACGCPFTGHTQQQGRRSRMPWSKEVYFAHQLFPSVLGYVA